MGNPKHLYSVPPPEPKRSKPPVEVTALIPADLHARMQSQAGKHFLKVETLIKDALEAEVKRWEDRYRK